MLWRGRFSADDVGFETLAHLCLKSLSQSGFVPSLDKYFLADSTARDIMADITLFEGNELKGFVLRTVFQRTI